MVGEGVVRGRRWQGGNNGGRGEMKGEELSLYATTPLDMFLYKIHHHPRHLAPQCMPTYH